MHRPLRYAPAAFFALLALAFVGLWVRSYYWRDSISGPLWGVRYECASHRGSTYFATHPTFDLGHSPVDWKLMSMRGVLFSGSTPRGGYLGFSVISRQAYRAMTLPHWFLAASSLALAALLAFKPITRFTVRGLLIATTLLAAVLGLAVYAL